MFRWSLHEIDETDIESLIPFVFEYPRWKGSQERERKTQAFAEDIDWL